jgi:hypothetical protein
LRTSVRAVTLLIALRVFIRWGCFYAQKTRLLTRNFFMSTATDLAQWFESYSCSKCPRISDFLHFSPPFNFFPCVASISASTHPLFKFSFSKLKSALGLRVLKFLELILAYFLRWTRLFSQKSIFAVFSPFEGRYGGASLIHALWCLPALFSLFLECFPMIILHFPLCFQWS